VEDPLLEEKAKLVPLSGKKQHFPMSFLERATFHPCGKPSRHPGLPCNTPPPKPIAPCGGRLWILPVKIVGCPLSTSLFQAISGPSPVTYLSGQCVTDVTCSYQ